MDDIVMTGTGGILQGNMGAATVRINQEGVIDFNGSSDYISIADHDSFSFTDGSNTDSAFSVSAWIRPEANSFPIMSKGRYNNSDGEYAFTINSSGHLAFELYDESVSSCYIGQKYTTAIRLYEWHHVAATYDASEASSGVKIYIDGALVSSAAYEGNAGLYLGMENLAANLNIGRYGDSSTYANGQIADVKIFNTELGSAEIGRLASHIGVNSVAAQDIVTTVLDLPLTIRHSNSTLDGAINSSVATIPTQEANVGNSVVAEYGHFWDYNKQNIIIGNEVMEVTGEAAVNAYIESNSFAATTTGTPGDINIDGVAITITASKTAAQVAAIVAGTTFPNYTAAVTSTDKVTLTQKVLGTVGNVAVTMSDAAYAKDGGGNHTVTFGSFANGNQNLTVSGRSGGVLRGTTAASHSDNDDIYIANFVDLSSNNHQLVLNGDIVAPITHSQFDRFSVDVMDGYVKLEDSGTNSAEELDATEVEFTVHDGTQFKVGQLIQVDDELMYISAINTHVLTIVRGVCGTTAATHNNPVDVYHANGTYFDGPITVQQGNLNNKAMSSALFDDSGDYINLGNYNEFAFGDSTDDSPFTFAAWIKPHDATSNMILSTYGQFKFGMNSSDKLYVTLLDNNSDVEYQVADLDMDIYENQWVHVAGTYSGVGGTSANAGIKLYINGVSQAMTPGDSGSYDSMHNLTNDTYIGYYYGAASEAFDGEMRDVRIYVQELSASQVASVYSNTYGVSPNHVYKLDEGTGSSANDTGVVTSRNGVLQGNTSLGGTNGTVDLDERLLIHSKGIFGAPRGDLLLGYTGANDDDRTIDVDGTFTHNNGNITIDSSSNCFFFGGGASFYEITPATASNELRFYEDMTIEKELKAGSGNPTLFKGGTTITLGSDTSSGTISRTLRVSIGSGAATVAGANPIYPGIIANYDDMARDLDLNLKWVDVTTTLTHNRNTTITLTGDCEFDAVTVSSGDEFDLNGNLARFEGNLTASAGSTIDVDGIIQMAADIDIADATVNNPGDCKLLFVNTASKDADLPDATFGAIAFNGNDEIQMLRASNLGTTPLYVGNGSSSDIDFKNNCTFGDLTIASGGQFDVSADQHTIAGNLTTSGGLISKSAADFITSDGASDGNYIQAGNTSNSDGWTNLTVECWIRLDHLGRQGDEGTFFSRGGNQLPKFGAYSGKLRMYGGTAAKAIGGTGDIGNTSGQETLVAGRWYHIALTYNNTTGAAVQYINGRIDNKGTVETGIMTSDVGASIIGAQSAGNRHMDGQMSRISIWNHELTQEEIQKLMFYNYATLDADSDFDSIKSDIKFFYEFDEENNTIDDKGPGGNNGTFTTYGGQAGAWAPDGALVSTASSGMLDFTGSGKYIYYNNNEVLPIIETSAGTLTLSCVDTAQASSTVQMQTMRIHGGTLNAGAGTIDIINEMASSGFCWSHTAGTFNHNSGTVKISHDTDSHIQENTFYNLIFAHQASSDESHWRVKSASTLTVANDLTITEGKLSLDTASNKLVVTRNMLIENGGTFNDDNDATGQHSFNSIDVESSGTLKLTAGSTDIGKNVNGTQFASSATATTITVEASHGIEAGDIIKIGNEKMYVTGVSTNDITVIRGFLNTMAANQANGSDIYKESVTKITGINGSTSRSVRCQSNSTLENNDGIVMFNSTSDQKVETAGGENLHDVVVYKTDNDFVWMADTTFEGSLDITLDAAHAARPTGAANTLTVTNAVRVREGILLRGENDCTGSMSFGSISIESGGTYAATSGTTTLTGPYADDHFLFQNAGTFTHNKGTVLFTYDSYGNCKSGGDAFYNVISDVNHGSYVGIQITDAFEVMNNFTINANDGFTCANGDTTIHGNVYCNGDWSRYNTSSRTQTIKGTLTIGSSGWYRPSSGTNNLGGIRNLGGSVN